MSDEWITWVVAAVAVSLAASCRPSAEPVRPTTVQPPARPLHGTPPAASERPSQLCPREVSEDALVEDCVQMFGRASDDPSPVGEDRIGWIAERCGSRPDAIPEQCDPARWVSAETARCLANRAGVPIPAERNVTLELRDEGVVWYFPAVIEESWCRYARVSAVTGDVTQFVMEIVY